MQGWQESGYFYNAIKRELSMVRGDTLSFAFALKGLEGQLPDEVVLSVKEDLEDVNPVITVSLDDTIDFRSYDESTDTLVYTVRIPPYKTEYIPLGRYYYDLEIKVNSDIFTLMIGRFNLEYEVHGGNTPTPPSQGDAIEYPRNDIVTGNEKIYTEEYVNDIALAINTIVEEDYSYTISEMSGAITLYLGGLITTLRARVQELEDNYPEEIDDTVFPVIE